MHTKIKENLSHPEILEGLYQSDKKSFKKVFFELYPEISNLDIAHFWKARFDQKNKTENFSIKKQDLFLVIISCLVAGVLIKLPQFFHIYTTEDLFYERNAGLIALLGLTVYAFLTRQTFNKNHVVLTGFVFLVSAVYINTLPILPLSYSIDLAYIHLPLLLWCMFGLVYIDFDLTDKYKRIDFIRYNGDLAVMATLIAIAGGILTVISMGLFQAIGINIEDFYLNWVIFLGAISLPIVSTYIVRSFPSVTNKIAPIIAFIFSPLVLITLVVFLVSMLFAGKDPYNDRDFLIIFNLMLLGVMAIIVFSVSESSFTINKKINNASLLLLTILAIIVDLIALSAILYRLGEFGFSPNRTVVLGSNLLFLGNLVLILFDLFRVNFRNEVIKKVELTIARYLPLYMGWTVFVVFFIPVLFGFS